VGLLLRWNPESMYLIAAKIAASLTLTLFAKISPKIFFFRQISQKFAGNLQFSGFKAGFQVNMRCFPPSPAR